MTAPASYRHMTAPAFRALLLSQCHAHGDKAALARKLGFSPSYIGDVLSGKLEPSERLAHALGYERHVVFCARAEL